jgi:hypothetical protein
MKLATLALASSFALSSTFALAYTKSNHRRSGVRTHHSAVRRSYSRTYRGRCTTVGVGPVVGMGTVRTTEAGWLAAATPVPNKP